MKNLILWLILFFAVILEGAITTLPLVLISFLILMIFLRTSFIFWIAFAIGLVLDIFLLRPLGLTSFMFTIFLFIVILYESKFEASTGYFVFIASFLGSLIYLSVLGTHNMVMQSIVMAFLALVTVKLLVYSEIKKPKYKLEK